MYNEMFLSKYILEMTSKTDTITTTTTNMYGILMGKQALLAFLEG